MAETLAAQLEDYNARNPVMDLVLLEQAVEHVNRIARILERPRGSALLVGVVGSGKQSLSRLACHIKGIPLRHINVTSDYSINDFRDFLKELYSLAGVKPATPICFLMSDGHIVDERFLVYVNDFLSSGYSADLFSAEELDALLASKAMKAAAKAAGVPEAKAALVDFFVQRVCSNLRVILCFSPVGACSEIINCTTINWFHAWSKEALVSVESMLEDMGRQRGEATDAVDRTSSRWSWRLLMPITSAKPCCRAWNHCLRTPASTPRR